MSDLRDVDRGLIELVLLEGKEYRDYKQTTRRNELRSQFSDLLSAHNEPEQTEDEAAAEFMESPDELRAEKALIERFGLNEKQDEAEQECVVSWCVKERDHAGPHWMSNGLLPVEQDDYAPAVTPEEKRTIAGRQDVEAGVERPITITITVSDGEKAVTKAGVNWSSTLSVERILSAALEILTPAMGAAPVPAEQDYSPDVTPQEAREITGRLGTEQEHPKPEYLRNLATFESEHPATQNALFTVADILEQQAGEQIENTQEWRSWKELQQHSYRCAMHAIDPDIRKAWEKIESFISGLLDAPEPVEQDVEAGGEQRLCDLPECSCLTADYAYRNCIHYKGTTPVQQGG